MWKGTWYHANMQTRKEGSANSYRGGVTRVTGCEMDRSEGVGGRVIIKKEGRPDV